MAGCHISSLILRTFPVFAVLLEKMNAITVCSGVSDQELQISLSDRTAGKEPYLLEKGKGKACTIKKCFRSSSCTYILPITSCTRCSKCQDFSVHFVVKESSLLLNLGLLMILMHNSAVSCALSLLPEQGIYKKC